MNYDKKRWQLRRKISFKKVEVKSPHENFLLKQYLDDLAKVCGKDGGTTLWKKGIRTTTYYFSDKTAALGFFCRVSCIKGAFSRMF